MVTSAAHSAAIELLQSESLTTLVAREVERRILAGEFLPGEKLNEEALAVKLGVSRGPVREAFRTLESSGLVRTEKNRGVFVREVSLDEADEIYEVRAGIDELIGRLLAKRIKPAQVAELRDLMKKMQQAAKARSVADYYPLNVRFHDRLAELTGNRTLLATIAGW
jgi:DNA-binding GntR family transcriptional regulator